MGAAEDADALIALVEHAQPDVVITDIRMPPRCTDDGCWRETRRPANVVMPSSVSR